MLPVDVINIHGRYNCQKSWPVIRPVTRVDSNLLFYDVIEWPKEQKYKRFMVVRMQRTNAAIEATIARKKVIVKAVIEEELHVYGSSWRKIESLDNSRNIIIRS